MAKTPAQLVRERLALAAKAQAEGNAQAAANYAQAAANIKGSGQAATQKAADQYAALAKAPVTQPQVDTDKGNGGGGGGGGNTDTTSDEEKSYWANRESLDNAANAQQREGAKAYFRTLLDSYGLGSLAGAAEGLVDQWGANTDVVFTKLKDTDQYKTRFKGLLDLRAKNVTDVANEAEYLNLESQYRSVFRENGMADFLGTPGSQSELQGIADLVAKYSVSVDEVRNRVSDAQRVVAETPQEVRESLQRYYNVDPATLVSFVLDPTRTSQRINQIANAAIIGGYGQKNSLNISSNTAEAIAQQQAGDQAVNGAAVSSKLQDIASIRNATSRLASIDKTDLTDDEVALADLGLDTNADTKIKGLQSRERARFGGSSGIGKGALARPNTF